MNLLQRSGRAFVRRFDTWQVPREDSQRISVTRLLPFLALHLGCVAVIWTGWSPFALWFAAGAWLVRKFAVTAFFHRYFSHRAFSTSRAVQFVLAFVGTACAQRGPLWWAAHHRQHHRFSDEEQDAHSPKRGFWRSHWLWFFEQRNRHTRIEEVRDFARFPELRFLDRFDIIPPVLFAAFTVALGFALQRWAPGLGTGPGQLFVWGFLISTVALYHTTFSINSLAHVFGSRRFETSDTSRNNFWLALLTFGEGWHNNHHRFPGSARQGFFWWEFDLSYYLLRTMAAFGLVWDLRPVPDKLLKPNSE
ncbi:MAG: acyl-CoA desaturase [Planctomycetota bacterium]|nr:acyl-CoA desaturase [Planctomycetota bacterium]